MNDFLQSLRNGQAEKPRTPKTRKNYDNSYHYSTPQRFNSYGSGGYQNTRNQQMKRPPVPHQPGNQLPMDDAATTSMMAEAIENLSIHIENMVKNQDYLISVQERTADILERQAIAIERIIDHLDIAPAPEPVPQRKSASEKTFENHYVTSQKPEWDVPEPVEVQVETPVEARIETPVEIYVEQPAETSVEHIESAKPILRKRKKIVAKQVEETISTENKLLSREIIMDIIQTMRAEGATFDQVASHLIELGQPTFSGRGEWHAQTIHRLCNKK